MIKHPETFDSARPAGFDGQFHWDFLLRAFRGTRIAPMDLDAMVERNWHFLFFETKAVGVPVPDGQSLALRRLVLSTSSYLIFCAKHPRDVSEWTTWTRDPDRRLDIKSERWEGTAGDLVAWVTKWFQTVNRMPCYLPPVYSQSQTQQSDLFQDLITDPVLIALHYLDRLTDKQLVTVFDEYGA